MGDSNRLETFSHVARELGKRGIAFICAREAQADDSIGVALKKAFGGPYIANEQFTLDSANAILAKATPMRWPSASPSSPTRTWSNACAKAPN